MKLYLAAIYTNGYRAGGNSGRYAKLTANEKKLVDSSTHLLESYHYIHRERFVRAIREDGAKVFLDSGAFSAHTMGIEINLAEYCQYIQRNQDILLRDDGVMMASVLDGIGDAQKTYENQMAMERLGVRPLPCFHYGEDPRYLEWYLANYPYVTIGGMVGKSREQLKAWLDPLWEKHMTDGAGRPRAKFHAFGITSIEIMERYPWHSVDSSSWVQKAAFGGILHPVWGHITVSSTSPTRKIEGRHFNTFSKLEQDAILAEIHKMGFDLERLATVYESRAAYNIWAYPYTLNHFEHAQHFENPQPTIFG